MTIIALIAACLAVCAIAFCAMLYGDAGGYRTGWRAGYSAGLRDAEYATRRDYQWN